MDDQCLVGTKIDDCTTPLASSISVGDGTELCILARTNICLFQKIVQIIECDNPASKRKKLKIAFVGV